MLLTLTLFLQLITEYTPKAAKSLPIIGIYFNFNLLLILISVVLTIVVLNFHFRGPKKYRVPKWMRIYLIGYLGYVLRITNNYETENPINRKKQEAALIPNVKKYSTSINYYDLKRNFIVKNSFKTTLASNINSTKSITSNPVSEANKSTKRLKNESNKKIENVISEMIASFEPAKIKDNNLKILVLKEILQSQISLIDLNEKRCKTRNEINLNEIYDEWKILAIITDRACFLIYLITLVSSTLFFYIYITINN